MPREQPDDTRETTFPRCPHCDTPVIMVVTRGPWTHNCQPCGCPITEKTTRKLSEK